MNDQITTLLENYKDGIPIRVEATTVVMLSVGTIVTVLVCALIVKQIKKP